MFQSLLHVPQPTCMEERLDMFYLGKSRNFSKFRNNYDDSHMASLQRRSSEFKSHGLPKEEELGIVLSSSAALIQVESSEFFEVLRPTYKGRGQNFSQFKSMYDDSPTASMQRKNAEFHISHIFSRYFYINYFLQIFYFLLQRESLKLFEVPQSSFSSYFPHISSYFSHNYFFHIFQIFLRISYKFPRNIFKSRRRGEEASKNFRFTTYWLKTSEYFQVPVPWEIQSYKILYGTFIFHFKTRIRTFFL